MNQTTALWAKIGSALLIVGGLWGPPVYNGLKWKLQAETPEPPSVAASADEYAGGEKYECSRPWRTFTGGKARVCAVFSND
jgi:hypothetical protein